ncbi:MAG: glycerol-3-phosphate 1-O-acyltransferase PlsY [Terriglobia bacterium]
MLTGVISTVVAYLVGAIPVGYLMVKWSRGQDVRAFGSGATGATNVTRTLGALGGVLTLALDVAKGYAAVEAAAWMSGGEHPWMAAAAVAAILGHSYPVFIGFRGGKGVATGVGTFLHFTPLGVGAALVVWLAVFLLWRYVALASVLATAAYPVFAYALARPPLAVMLAGVLGACVILLRHRSNLEQLVRGTEPKFRLRRRD